MVIRELTFPNVRPTSLLGLLCLLSIALLAWPPAGGTAIADPPQVGLADRMVQELSSVDGNPNPDNSYGTPVTVTWKGILGEQKTFNRSQCASFVTALMKAAYGYSDDEYRAWFGSKSPFADHYQSILEQGTGPFESVASVSDLRPGDIIAIKYPPEESATGHVMMVRELPVPAVSSGPAIAGTQQYEVDVIDSSSGTHGPADSRRLANGTQQGVGRGTVRLYADGQGKLVGYAWSLESSTAYTREERPISAGRIAVDSRVPEAPPGTEEPSDPPATESLRITIDPNSKPRRINGSYSGTSSARIKINIRRRSGRRCTSVGPKRSVRTKCAIAKKRWYAVRQVSDHRWTFRLPRVPRGRYSIRVQIIAGGDRATSTRRARLGVPTR